MSHRSHVLTAWYTVPGLRATSFIATRSQSNYLQSGSSEFWLTLNLSPPLKTLIPSTLSPPPTILRDWSEIPADSPTISSQPQVEQTSRGNIMQCCQWTMTLCEASQTVQTKPEHCPKGHMLCILFPGSSSEVPLLSSFHLDNSHTFDEKTTSHQSKQRNSADLEPVS